MRLPFLQVSQEEMARARTLAGYLGVPYAHALGMTVAIKAAALEAAPGDDVSGVIRDPNPAEWLAVQCGWPLERADVLAAALARCGFAMAGPSGGHVVAGMEPYARALDTSDKRADAGRRGAEARKMKGGYGRAMAEPQQTHGQDMARDAKTQTQTQTQTQREEAFSASRSAGAEASGEDLPDATEHAHPAERPPLVLEPSPSDAPPEEPKKRERRLSAAEEVYANTQASREDACTAAGVPFVPDRWTPAMVNKQLGALVKGSDEDRKRFRDGWVCYLGDEKHRDKGWPLTLFFHGPVRSRYEAQALREAGGTP